jgi:hypothetical protein
MRIILVLLSTLFLPIFFYGQNIRLKNDTLGYQFQKYYVGKEIRLGRGSSKDHDFSYVYWGMLAEPANPIDHQWANTIVVVENIYSLNDKYFLRCSAKGVVAKFHIDVMKAVAAGEVR